MPPKAADTLLKRYRNNVRVDPATLKHYLCYYCGHTVPDRLEYQQHMLKVHEVMSQSYQLWSDHTMDTLGLRWSESKRGEDPGRENSGSAPQSPSTKKGDSDENDEDYVYEEDLKRKKKEEEAAKKAFLEQEKERKRLETNARRRKRDEERRKAERARKEEELRTKQWEETIANVLRSEVAAEEEKKETEKIEKTEKAEKTTKETSAPPVAVSAPPPKKRKKTTSTSECPRWKQIASESSDKPEVTALVKKILEESKRKETSSQEVEEEEMAGELVNRRPFEFSRSATKYCRICKKGTHFVFETLFEHYLDHHNATLQSFYYFGYKGRQLIGKKRLMERDYCQRCVIKFDRPRDYFLHMIQNHLYESIRCQLDFENATNADVEVRFQFRDRPIICGYNFVFDQIPENKLLKEAPAGKLATIEEDVKNEEEKNIPSTSGSSDQDPTNKL